MKKLIVVILLTMCLNIILAEDYTLDQLIEYGIQNASSIQRSELNKDNSESNHISSWLDFLPSATASYDRSGKYLDEYESGGLSLSKTIALNEGTYFNFRNSSINRTIADVNLETAEKNLAYSILEQYLNILQTQKELEIQQENLALQDRTYQEITLQVQQGRKTAIDLNQTEIDKVDTEIQIESLTNSLSNMRLDLFALLKMEDNNGDFVEVSLPIIAIDDIGLSSELSTEMSFNPHNIYIDYLELKKMKINEWQHKLNFLPSITFTAGYGWDSEDHEVFGTKDYTEGYSLSLSVSYSLFNIFNQGQNYRRYKNSMQTTQLNLEDDIDDFNNQFEKMMREIKFLHKSRNLYDRKLSQSSENLTIANERYTLGLIDLVELDRSRISNLQAQISLNQNYYSILKTQEKLNKLLSEPIMKRW